MYLIINLMSNISNIMEDFYDIRVGTARITGGDPRVNRIVLPRRTPRPRKSFPVSHSPHVSRPLRAMAFSLRGTPSTRRVFESIGRLGTKNATLPRFLFFCGELRWSFSSGAGCRVRAGFHCGSRCRPAPPRGDAGRRSTTSRARRPGKTQPELKRLDPYLI